MYGYQVTQTTWEHGRSTNTAVTGPVRDALIGIAAQALDLSPAIGSVVFEAPDLLSRITVFRSEAIEVPV